MLLVPEWKYAVNCSFQSMYSTTPFYLPVTPRSSTGAPQPPSYGYSPLSAAMPSMSMFQDNYAAGNCFILGSSTGLRFNPSAFSIAT
jgi:hypothetical protein